MNDRVTQMAQEAKKNIFAHWQTWLVLILIFLSGLSVGTTAGIAYTSGKAAKEIASIRDDYRKRADERDQKVESLARRVQAIPDETVGKLTTDEKSAASEK